MTAASPGSFSTAVASAQAELTQSLAKDTVTLNPSFPILSRIRMRDRIVVNPALQKKLDSETVSGSVVTLVARLIEHEPGFVLRLPGRRIRLVASEYNSKDGAVDVSGDTGSAGSDGATGSPGYASITPRNSRPGGAGGPGGPGGPGSDAGGIELICERLRGGRFLASGGAGGAGGAGGTGGQGGNGFVVRKPINPETAEGTAGGRGGAAGPGGAGGKGGQIRVAFVTADNPSALRMDVNGGVAGAAGARGKGGKAGRMGADAAAGASGAASRAGSRGTPGKADSVPVKIAGYWSRAAARLASSTDAWAAYRVEAGLYYYRAFQQSDAARKGYLQLAMSEFDAALHLQPANTAAARFQKQILLNQNVLGQPRDLDIIPDFARYNADYAPWANLVSSAYNSGILLMLQSVTLQAAADLFSVYVSDIERRIPVDGLDRDAAQVGQSAAQEVLEYATARVNELNGQIQAALEEMKNQSISIGAVVTTVAEVGAAVASVAAAVPTGGASLVALVPDIAALAMTLAPIANEVFGPSKQEMDKLKTAYGRVGKDVKDIKEGAKSFISLVGSVQKLIQGTTPDNTKFVSLIRRTVELAHELLLAKLHKEQANLTLEARETQLVNDTALLQLAKGQLAQLRANVNVLRSAGHTAVLNTQGYIDLLLNIAFKAERSVEIYTFRDESARVFFDNGYVHPDLEHDYADGDIDSPALITQYTQSWSKALEPIGLQLDYEKYFAGDAKFDFSSGVLVRSFKDAASLAEFKATRTLKFGVDLLDLPGGEFEAKIEAVHVALVGAAAPNGFVRCRVRRGSRYILETRNGEEVVMLLQPHVTGVSAAITRLPVVGTPPTSGAGTLSAPLNLSFWGRGVAGDWELKVPESEVAAEHVDFAGLTEIQVWIATQVFLPVA